MQSTRKRTEVETARSTAALSRSCGISAVVTAGSSSTATSSSSSRGSWWPGMWRPLTKYRSPNCWLPRIVCSLLIPKLRGSLLRICRTIVASTIPGSPPLSRRAHQGENAETRTQGQGAENIGKGRNNFDVAASMAIIGEVDFRGETIWERIVGRQGGAIALIAASLDLLIIPYSGVIESLRCWSKCAPNKRIRDLTNIWRKEASATKRHWAGDIPQEKT